MGVAKGKNQKLLMEKRINTAIPRDDGYEPLSREDDSVCVCVREKATVRFLSRENERASTV